MRSKLKGNWYYEENHKESGPHPITRIHELLEEGELSASSMVWHPSLPRWVSAGEAGVTPLQPGEAALPPTVPRTWVWALAFAWLIKGAIGLTDIPILLASPLVNLALILIDNKTLESAGHQPLSIWRGVLFAPLHLTARAKALGEGPAPLITWIVVTLFASIPILFALFLGVALIGFV